MRKPDGPRGRYFGTRMVHSESAAAVWRVIAQYLQRWISSTSRILDLGAGYCYFINAVTARERWALDIDDVVRQHAERGVRTLVRSAGGGLPFKDGSLDVVFASNFFEHLTPEEGLRVLEEVHRTLAKHGKLIVIQPDFKYCPSVYFDDYTHRTVYTHISFSDFLQANGFEVEACRPRFLPATMKSGLPRARFLVWLYLRSPVKPFAGQFLIVARKR
jgi:SAM-dependent methyltransferase